MKKLWNNIQWWVRSARSYHKFIKVARNSKPYDWEYLIKIEQAYLKRMLCYMRESEYFDHSNNIKWITKCIDLLDIVIEDDSTYAGYINLRNAHRFHPIGLTPDKEDVWLNYMKNYPTDLRWQKAYDLYFAIRKTYTTQWWD